MESFPPFFLMFTRFTCSGLAILIAAWFMGARFPKGSDLLRIARNGIIILGVGTGCLVFAEQWIPSGLAAVFITTGPFWMVGLEALVPGGAKLHGPTLAGMLLGLAGVGVLVAPNGWNGISKAILTGFLTLQLGCMAWSLGSILQRRKPPDAHPIVSGGVQQLATGLAFIIPALLFEPSKNVHWSTRGGLALLYLVIFGSIVGYSAYIYTLENLPVAIVSIYNYLNPIVAVLLGWLFYREPFGQREALAMVIIFAGVATVKRFSFRAVSQTRR